MTYRELQERYLKIIKMLDIWHLNSNQRIAIQAEAKRTIQMMKEIEKAVKSKT